jgi:Lipocalin-like domain
MKRCTILNIIIIVLTATWLGVFSSSAISQQKSLKEQLVGTWIFVSSNANGPDGRPQWGENPKGLFIMSDSGYFSWQVFRSDRPHLASNNRLNATADELKALNQGMLAYFGTYSVDEVEKTVTFRTEASTYPNSEGEIIKRVITKISPDEMTYTNPANTLGARVEAAWKRLK